MRKSELLVFIPRLFVSNRAQRYIFASFPRLSQSGRYGKEHIGQLMTSVTAPILDRRNYTVTFFSNKIWDCARSDLTVCNYARAHTHTHTQMYTFLLFPIYASQTKTANLLGIVGTDVPIEEIQKLVPPYKVGNISFTKIRVVPVQMGGRLFYRFAVGCQRIFFYRRQQRPCFVSPGFTTIGE